MLRITVYLLIAMIILLFYFFWSSEERHIRIVGSSTVYPYVTIVAEQFGLGTEYNTPIVESTGTGGGFKLFCGGVGERFPDINNASRPIKESERALCAKHGVRDITEIKIGYDGIIIANVVTGANYSLTKEQIFLALARKVPVNKSLVDNPYIKWSDVDTSLPDSEIVVYGPPPTSGTRDAFLELVMEKVCTSFPEFKEAYPDKNDRKKACAMLREDGRYVDAGEDDNMIIKKTTSNKGALGILGYSFLEENRDKIKAASINGVVPNEETIESGNYKISRSLFVYIKDAHLDNGSGLRAFAREISSPATIGRDGYLVMNGLLPLSDSEMERIVALHHKLLLH